EPMICRLTSPRSDKRASSSADSQSIVQISQSLTVMGNAPAPSAIRCRSTIASAGVLAGGHALASPSERFHDAAVSASGRKIWPKGAAPDHLGERVYPSIVD